MNNTFEQLSTNEVAQLQKQFLNWYFMHARNLPWRENTDPYRIWISEIMLQQTRVDTVIDYFHRFLKLQVVLWQVLNRFLLLENLYYTLLRFYL